MSVIICRAVLALIIFYASITLSCGKSKESKETEGETVQRADSALSAAIAAAPFKEVLEKAGFTIININEFPTAVARRTGQAVVYRSIAKNRSGGILYFKNDRERSFPTWHWYFNEDAPDSVNAVELNDDGMWDIRMSMSDGSGREFLQDEEFTLFAESRPDWIALNGTSSSATDPGHPMWKCFDGHGNTSWRSSLRAGDEVYLEFWAPFGIQRGVLTIQTVDEDRPRECELYADGKLIKQFTLEDRSGEQKVQIAKTQQNSVKMRFVARSSYGEGGNVSIAELKLE